MGDEMAEGAMSKLDTDFKDHGTLRPPGPFGRVVRLGFGILTLLPVVSLVPQARTLLSLSGMPTHFTWWLAVALGLWVFPYVINIGFTVSWHGWPRTVALIVLATSVALVGGRMMRVGPSQGGSRLPRAHSRRAS
jgi:hypothetical protein